MNSETRIEAGLKLTSMEMALRYGIGVGTFITYQKWAGFPLHSKSREGILVYWDAEAVDRWMNNRPDRKSVV